MSNISEFPSRKDRRLEEAGDWIAAIGRGLTEEDEQELGAWLSSSSANYDVFMELACLWDDMDGLGRLADLFPEPAPKRRYPSSRAILATAASIVVALALFAVFQTPDIADQTMGEPASVVMAGSYSTEIGEQSTHQLSDGSIITLNTNSSVRVDFTESNRLLILERGELHVKVAHDPDRRLSVIVGNRVVQAVGTEFNVEITQDQSIELVVTDGVVMVGVVDATDEEASPDTPLLLTQSSTVVGAGEGVLIAANDQNAESVDAERVESDEIAVKLSWREGNLIFRGESLEEAVAEVGRYTAVEFVFLDEDAKAVRVAGLFKAGDVEGLLSALRNHFDITYEWQGEDRILLSAEEDSTDR